MSASLENILLDELKDLRETWQSWLDASSVEEASVHSERFQADLDSIIELLENLTGNKPE